MRFPCPVKKTLQDWQLIYSWPPVVAQLCFNYEKEIKPGAYACPGGSKGDQDGTIHSCRR